MVNDQDDDLEIGSLYAHREREPPHAIATTSGQKAIYVKPDLLAILHVFLGRSYDSPYEFLHEFCKICRVQERPTGSSEDDFKLKAIPLSLKGEANIWFRRLPTDSIRTWPDFRRMFLEQFFPVAKTNALRKEIQGVTQGYDESLNKYWSRYIGLLDACPNHHMLEVEIYSKFHEEMNEGSKDLVNSSSGKSFSKLQVSEAKVIIGKLLYAKRSYDNPQVVLPQGDMVKATTGGNDNQLESRVDKLERALLSAIKKKNP